MGWEGSFPACAHVLPSKRRVLSLSLVSKCFHWRFGGSKTLISRGQTKNRNPFRVARWPQ